jgi:cytochrome c
MRFEGRSSRMLLTALVAATALTLSAAFAGCTAAVDTPAATSTTATSTAAGSGAASSTAQPTRADVQAFVEKAVAYVAANGKAVALEAFTSPGGEFHKGTLYIYAYDFEGTVIAHGGDKTLVGKNLIDMKDTNGVEVIRELVRLAKTGSGWLYYTWPNPANGNAQEPKLGYVVKVDDTWFLGSGAYGPAAAQP